MVFCHEDLLFFALSKQLWSQQALGAHDVEDENTPDILTVEDAAGRFDDLPIAPAFKLLGFGAAFRVVLKLVYVPEYFPNEPPCRFRIVQRDVIGDGVQIAERRFGPDYFSHRAMRFLASA